MNVNWKAWSEKSTLLVELNIGLIGKQLSITQSYECSKKEFEFALIYVENIRKKCLSSIAIAFVWRFVFDISYKNIAGCKSTRANAKQDILWKMKQILNVHDINTQLYGHTCMLVELEFQVS